MNKSELDFTLPPFPAFPCVSRYTPVGPVMEALSRVSRSVIAREAVTAVIGPPGTGKSVLCGLIAQQFLDSHDVVVMGETAVSTKEEFQRALLHRLGVAMETTVPNDMRLMLDERLSGPDANPNGLVLVIDEAAALSIDVLESIRQVTNIMREGQPAVSVVLAGGVKLDETLTSPKLDSLVQRISARCYLHPLNGTETRDYIRACIAACDASPEDTITEEAMSAIHHASSGVTRLINQLMTEAIDCAAEMDETLIGEHTVDRAWASLQQLPGPMMDEPAIKGTSSVVEFGELSDDFGSESMDGAATDSDDSNVSEMSPLVEAAPPVETAPQSDPAIVAMVNPTESFDLSEMDTEIGKQSELPVDSVAADPGSLFGTFDEEEEISIGDSPLEEKPSSTHLALESMLHSEIISLSHFAAENTEVSRHELDAPEFHSAMSSSATKAPASSRETPSSAATAIQGGNDVPSVVWYDEPESGMAEEQSDAASVKQLDDSDLLWITEDIDVDQRDVSNGIHAGPHRVDSASGPDAPKLNVDYRELLSKMRNQG